MSLWASWAGRRRAVLVRTTVGTRPQAEALARRLVEDRLAACVHVSEVASTYRWDGRVRQETEYLVEARTLPGRPTGATAKAILRGHPYEEPLVEVMSPTAVNARYGDWMRGEVS
jgi:periplasmic divalent cation tolerance protein